MISSFNLNADILKKIEVDGNKRISQETIIVYGDIEINRNYNQTDIDNVIKKLFETKFFSNISTSFNNGVLKITVVENPIINSIILEGEKTKKFREAILTSMSLKEKSSFIKSDVKNDLEIIKFFYQTLGYYSPEVEARVQEVSDSENLVNFI